jgi:hypothetical protein
VLLAIPAVALGLNDSSPKSIIAALSRERASYGLPPVHERPALSAGCAAYDRYLIRNGRQYLLLDSGHFETPGRPGYTRAGDQAARTSVLAFGSTLAWSQADPWDSAAFHIFQLLNPAIAVSGADERPMNLGAGYGTVNLECLRTFVGPFRRGPSTMRTYFAPAGGQPVPAFVVNGENQTIFGTAPGRMGPPLLFVYFLGRTARHVTVRAIHASLAGKPLRVVGSFVGGASGPAGASRPPALFASPEPAAVLTFTRGSYHPPAGKQPLAIAMRVTPSGGRSTEVRVALTVTR